MFGGTLSTTQPNQNNTANELNNNKDGKVAMSKTIELDVLNKELSELQDAYSKEVIVGEHLEKTLKTEQQTYSSLNTRFHELEQQKIKHLEIAKQLADYLADFETEEQADGMQNKSMNATAKDQNFDSGLSNGNNYSVGIQTDASTNTASNNFQATTRFLDKSTTTIIGNVEPATIEEILD